MNTKELVRQIASCNPGFKHSCSAKNTHGISKSFFFITLYKLCAFPVRICIPVEDVHSRCGTFPFPVRMNHNGMNILTGSTYSHREWGCTSQGIHILTRNGDVPHRECISSPGKHIVYTGCSLTSKRRIYLHPNFF